MGLFIDGSVQGFSIRPPKSFKPNKQTTWIHESPYLEQSRDNAQKRKESTDMKKSRDNDRKKVCIKVTTCSSKIIL